MKNQLKKILKKALPDKLFIIYRFLKKQLRFVPKDEQIYFDTNTVYGGHFKVTYRGIRAIRCPFDYVIYQMIIFDDLLMRRYANMPVYEISFFHRNGGFRIH